MLAFCTLDTASVETGKDAFVRPAGTVTCAGGVALALLLARVTGVPPVGAAAFRFTVHDVLDPPIKVLGEQTTDKTPG